MGPDLLPANIDLSLAEIELIHTVNRERRLAGMLAPLRDEYDFVLMDCQPSLGLLTVNAFAASDEVLVPLVCEFLSTRAVDVLLRFVRKVQVQVNSKLKVAGILPTMFDGRLRHVRAELDRLEQRFQGKVPVLSDCAVPRSVRFAEAAVGAVDIVVHAGPCGRGGVSPPGRALAGRSGGAGEGGRRAESGSAPGDGLLLADEPLDVFTRKTAAPTAGGRLTARDDGSDCRGPSDRPRRPAGPNGGGCVMRAGAEPYRSKS